MRGLQEGGSLRAEHDKIAAEWAGLALLFCRELNKPS